MKIFTKPELIEKLIEISNRGWIENARHGNHGGIGNTLEDLLGIEENNLPIPNASEWELKTARLNSKALTTLIHIEPSPRALNIVPGILLPHYGWKHKQAGLKYPLTEKSFRQTIHGMSHSNRGFRVMIDRINQKIIISFTSGNIDKVHKSWSKSVLKSIGHNELNPQPYWGFDDLRNVVGRKLPNCFYVQALVKKENGKEFYHYTKITMLEKFNFDGFLDLIEEGNILVDFDARTGHNHGTKFRLRQNQFPRLYKKVTTIL